MERIRVRVSKIKCAQSSIGSTFRDGRSVEDLVRDLRSDRVKAQELNIRVYQHTDGEYYALDHRRMWAVREASSRSYYFFVWLDRNAEAEFRSKFTGNGWWPDSLTEERAFGLPMQANPFGLPMQANPFGLLSTQANPFGLSTQTNPFGLTTQANPFGLTTQAKPVCCCQHRYRQWKELVDGLRRSIAQKDVVIRQKDDEIDELEQDLNDAELKLKAAEANIQQKDDEIDELEQDLNDAELKLKAAEANKSELMTNAEAARRRLEDENKLLKSQLESSALLSVWRFCADFWLLWVICVFGFWFVAKYTGR